MKKEVPKSIMKRSRLRKKLLKNENEINRNNYKAQRNYCKKLQRNSTSRFRFPKF